MRVIHVAPTPFGPGGLFGGGERFPLELARAVAAEVDCQLITFARQPWQIDEPGGLRIRALRTAGFYHGHPAHPLAPALPAALRGADIVHTHHLRSTPGRVAAVTAKLLFKRTAVTDHGLGGGDWAGLLPRLFDRFLAVSAYSAQLLHSPPTRTRIIYGGADPHRYAPDPEVARAGVLFLGRVTPHKGIDRLIEALPDGATLSIAGSEGHDPQPPENGYPALLRRLAIGKDVRFLGAVRDEDLPELLRSARVLVLPSVHRSVYGRTIAVSELLGLVLLESMASGTPVIASRLGGIPEIVDDGRTGYLVEPGNVAALRDRLSTILGDPALAQRMGRAARAPRPRTVHLAHLCRTLPIRVPGIIARSVTSDRVRPVAPMPRRSACACICPHRPPAGVRTAMAAGYQASLSDRNVLALAHAEGWILITNDRDFGELVFQHDQPHAGIILLRLSTTRLVINQQRLAEVLVNDADQLGRFLSVSLRQSIPSASDRPAP